MNETKRSKAVIRAEIGALAKECVQLFTDYTAGRIDALVMREALVRAATLKREYEESDVD